MSWKAVRNELQVDGESVEILPYPVREAREVNGTIVLVLEIPPSVAYPDNVFGYVKDESRLWQIDPCGYYTVAAPDVRAIGISPLARPGEARVFTWIGVNVRIDLKTGKVVGTEIGK